MTWAQKSRSEKGRQMDEMEARIAVKGGWSTEKRVQMVFFERSIVMGKTGY